MGRVLSISLVGLLAAGGGGELVSAALATDRAPVAVGSQACPGADMIPSPATFAQAQAAVVCLINQARAGDGEGALTQNALLDTTARQHSEDMVAHDYFNTTTPGGVTALARMSQAGFSAPLGETIAFGQGAGSSPSAAVSRWLTDPGAHVVMFATTGSQVGIGLASGVPAANSIGPAAGPGVTYSADFGAGAGGANTPQFGRSVGVQLVSGTVTVTRPDGTTQPLGGSQTLPVGSTIDASKGRIHLSVATPGAAGAQAHSAAGGQGADFYDGAFVVSQQRTLPYTIVKLVKGDFSSCGKAKKASAAASKRPSKAVRRVWGSGKGSFRTAGRYAAATVRGTIWLTVDYCNGTLIRVRRGVVSVKDRVHHRTVTVRAGSQYFAAK